MRKNINSFIQGILSELQSRFSELYGGRMVHLVLYGSQARGEAESGSDIDVLVVLKGPVDAGLEIARTGEIVAELSLNHDVAIACVFMEEERYLYRQGPFLRNVRREGIVFEELLAEIKRGLDSGEPTALDIAEIKARGRKKLAAESKKANT